MSKKNFLSKLTAKDYNNVLETVLEKKYFSEDTKNILLSMLYNIESFYGDYATIKKDSIDKNTFIENIINSIEQDCEEIEIIKPKTKEEGKKFELELDKENKKMRTCPNERCLLYGLAKISKEEMYLEDKYILIKQPIEHLLKEGDTINTVEVIRDFTGWSWDVQIDEIPNIEANLIYQNLLILLGKDFMMDLIKNKTSFDYIDLLKKQLEDLYKREEVEKLLKGFYRMALIQLINQDPKKIEIILQEKEKLQEELKKLENKTELLIEVSNQKKTAMRAINSIDSIINNKGLLQDEYVRRNSKLKINEKIFSISNLVEILANERIQHLLAIKECNEIADPKRYVKKKNKIIEDLKLIDSLELEPNKKIDPFDTLITIQKVFLNCFEIKIEQAKTKKEIVDLLYQFRYFKMLPYRKNIYLKDIEALKSAIARIEDIIVNKACDMKVLTFINADLKVNAIILGSILNTKIIKLENIIVTLKIEENRLVIEVKDSDVLENTITLKLKGVLDEKKLNKPVKLFI